MKYIFSALILVLLFLCWLVVDSRVSRAEASTFGYLVRQPESSELYVLIGGIPGTEKTINPLASSLSRAGAGVLLFSLKGESIDEDVSFIVKTLLPLEQNIHLVLHDRGGLVGLLAANDMEVSSITLLNSLIRPANPPFSQNTLGNIVVDILYSDSFIGSLVTSATLSQGGISDVQPEYIPDRRKHIRLFFKNFNTLESYKDEISSSLIKNSERIRVIWGAQDPFLSEGEQLLGIKEESILLVEDASHFIGNTHPGLITELLLNQ